MRRLLAALLLAPSLAWADEMVCRFVGRSDVVPPNPCPIHFFLVADNDLRVVERCPGQPRRRDLTVVTTNGPGNLIALWNVDWSNDALKTATSPMQTQVQLWSISFPLRQVAVAIAYANARPHAATTAMACQ